MYQSYVPEAVPMSSSRLLPSLAARALVAALLGACDEPSRPWDRPGSPPPPPLPSASSSSGAAEPDDARSATVGGSEAYARCAEGLRPSDDPVRDVVRLGTSCGPSTGMQRVGEVPHEGVLRGGGPPLGLPVRLRAGRCYRLFAVGEPALEELSIELRSSRGTTLARDRSTGRVVVLQPEGPVCAAGDDDATLLISARRGSGRFALELWWHARAGDVDG